MAEHPVRLDGKSLTIFDVVHAARDRWPVEIAESAWNAISKGRSRVDQVLAEGGEAYGVTTGVGSQKDASIPAEEVERFNQRLLVAHATVSSDRVFTPQTIRAALVVQLNGFVSGASGVSTDLVRALYDRLAHDRMPPANKGASVGASDLVPLAQMALSLLGVTSPLDPGFQAPRQVSLKAKEALSLINSNAVSLGYGALTLLQARKLLRGFDLAACLAWEGFRGNLSAVHPAVLRAHPQPGQATATEHIRRLLSSSDLWNPKESRALQDPLSFRCAPQVHGACYSALEWVWRTWETEINSVMDNPVVDLGGDRLISHGNMDGTLLTLGLDNLRSALATVVDISAQRLHKQHWPAFSDLPPGLAQDWSPLGGVQFLNLGHIAEAFASRVRADARPALLNYQGQLADGVEDHATLLPNSVTATDHLIQNAWVVQALELTVAVWAIRRRNIDPSTLGEGIRKVFAIINERLPIDREGDEVFDIRPLVDLVRDGEIVNLIDDAAPPVPEFIPPEG